MVNDMFAVNREFMPTFQHYIAWADRGPLAFARYPGDLDGPDLEGGAWRR